MITVERGNRRIYKNFEWGIKILSTVKIRGLESDTYYLVEEKGRTVYGKEDTVTIETRILEDVNIYFDLLKDVEGYSDYNYADIERKSLFKRNQGGIY